MAKKVCYVVIKGHRPGIYLNWSDCAKQVSKFKGQEYFGLDKYPTNEEIKGYEKRSGVSNFYVQTHKDIKQTEINSEKIVNIIDAVNFFNYLYVNKEYSLDPKHPIDIWVDGSYNDLNSTAGSGVYIEQNGIPVFEIILNTRDTRILSERHICGEMMAASCAIKLIGDTFNVCSVRLHYDYAPIGTVIKSVINGVDYKCNSKVASLAYNLINSYYINNKFLELTPIKFDSHQNYTPTQGEKVDKLARIACNLDINK